METRFRMACKDGQFDVVERMANHQFQTQSINLNAQHVNELTHFHHGNIYGSNREAYFGLVRNMINCGFSRETILEVC